MGVGIYNKNIFMRWYLKIEVTYVWILHFGFMFRVPYVYVCCLVILLPHFQNVWVSGVRLAFHASALSHLLS